MDKEIQRLLDKGIVMSTYEFYPRYQCPDCGVIYESETGRPHPNCPGSPMTNEILARLERIETIMKSIQEAVVTPTHTGMVEAFLGKYAESEEPSDE